MKILSEVVPANIEFYRKPIAVTQAPTPKHSPSIPASSALSEAALEAQGPAPPVQEQAGIYGSVSTADIVANLKAILANSEEGSRVILAPEDVSFVEKTDEKDRVKTLGIFEIDLRVKGSSDSIRRTIQVHALD